MSILSNNGADLKSLLIEKLKKSRAEGMNKVRSLNYKRFDRMGHELKIGDFVYFLNTWEDKTMVQEAVVIDIMDVDITDESASNDAVIIEFIDPFCTDMDNVKSIQEMVMSYKLLKYNIQI